MQYVLDMALNTKIPDDLVHKLSFECFRNWLQWLECLWFNFKSGIFPQLLVVFTRIVFMQPFWSCDSWSGYAADKDSLSSKACQGKQQQILQIVMNHQSNQVETCKSYEYWSANANFSELCDKGHKTKGQILLHLYGSLWTKSSGFLVFLIMSSTYCIARTLSGNKHGMKQESNKDVVVSCIYIVVVYLCRICSILRNLLSWIVLPCHSSYKTLMLETAQILFFSWFATVKSEKHLYTSKRILVT